MTGSTVIPALASGRRLARRIALSQLAVACVLSALFLLSSPSAALAAALGGVAQALGTWVMAWRGLPQRAPGPSDALWGWFSGLLLKILLVGLVLLLGLGVWRLPPLPLLLGVFAALLTFPVAAAFTSLSAGSQPPQSRH
jgi:F0F1-type ATP synthase assembly protein I